AHPIDHCLTVLPRLHWFLRLDVGQSRASLASLSRELMHLPNVFPRRVALFLLGTVLFALVYCQAPLFYSNQNQYFLHGLAQAGLSLVFAGRRRRAPHRRAGAATLRVRRAARGRRLAVRARPSLPCRSQCRSRRHAAFRLSARRRTADVGLCLVAVGRGTAA